MASLVDEETTSQYHDIGQNVITYLKTFAFFVFYEKQQLGEDLSNFSIEKLSFKLKDQKVQHGEKYQQHNKNVQLNFYSMQNEIELSNSLHDLKLSAHQFKTRLIFYSSEASMLNFFIKAKIFNINLDSIPFSIYSKGIHHDLANFLGWGKPDTSLFTVLSLSSHQKQIRNWLVSPTEKIDIWSVDITVAEDGGLIQKISSTPEQDFLSSLKTHRQYFTSSMSVGYHPQLLIDYEQRKSKKSNLMNKLIYSFEGLKKFCCVGNTGMRESTGVVKIDFENENGSKQILKQLREHEGQNEQDYIKSKDGKNKKKILSLVLSNIGHFLGEKLNSSIQSKMNDKKLQLLSYQSINKYSRISSISGKININFETEHPVYLQVNDSCYRLNKPISLKVENYGKAKVLINKQTMSY